MCRTNDDIVGIPLPLPSVVPSIESWYVVARNIKTGTCSMYSSWKNYQEEKEIASPASKKKKKRRSIDDARTTELAAFPTVAQAIAYVRNVAPQSTQETASPITASVTSTPGTNSTLGNTIVGEPIQSNLSPDHSHSSVPQDAATAIANDTNKASRNSPLSRSRKRILKTTKVVEENDQDDGVAAKAARSSPSPVPSEIPLKKRKTDNDPVPKFTNRPLVMSKTSETIDIGAPKQRKEDLSSLDALVMAASASRGKKGENSKPLDTSKRSMMENARLSSQELLASKGALDANMRALSPAVLASTIAARTIAEKRRQQELLLNKLQREDEELKRQILEEEEKLQCFKLRREVMSLPKVPKVSPLSSLKIPEVPKGFVPADEDSDKITRAISSLKSSIDRKILMNNAAAPSLNLPSAAAGLSNRLSLDSYPLGNFPSQLQNLPRHLQALHQASMYRNSANMLSSMELQSTKNPLIHHLRNGTITAAELRLHQLRNAHMIDLASSSSDCDHSEITLKRRNGLSSETSSPLTIGAKSKKSDTMGRKKK